MVVASPLATTLGCEEGLRNILLARRHEQLSQPPSVCTPTGFLVPHRFQREPDRQPPDHQLSFAELAAELATLSVPTCDERYKTQKIAKLC